MVALLKSADTVETSVGQVVERPLVSESDLRYERRKVGRSYPTYGSYRLGEEKRQTQVWKSGRKNQ